MGLYRKPEFLSEAQMQKIHESSLHLLQHKGVVFKSEKAREVLKQHGAEIKCIVSCQILKFHFH